MATPRIRSTVPIQLILGLLVGAAAVGIGTWSAQVVLLLGGLAVAFLLLVRASDVSWAFAALLIETSLLDRFPFPLHGLNIRPELVVAVPAVLFVGLSILRGRPRPRLLIPDIFLLGWLGLNGIASLFAPHPLLSLKEWVSLSLSASAYFLVRWLTREGLREAVQLLLSLGTAACGLGLAAYLASPFGFSLGSQLNRDAHAMMAVGTFKEADIFGSFAACLLLLAAGCIVTRQPYERLSWLALCISAVALAASLARTPWVAAPMGAICAAIVWRRGGYTAYLRVLAAAGVTALAGGILLSLMGTSQPRRDPTPVPVSNTTVAASAGPSMESPPHLAQTSTINSRGIVERIRSLFDLQTDPTVQGRVLTARLAIADWRKSPLLGRGTASFGQVYTDTSHQPAWISNIELRALHDTGLIGLCMFSGFAIGLTAMGFARKSEWAESLRTVLVIAVLVLWFAAQGTEPFQLMWPWILLGLLATALSNAPPEPALAQRGLAETSSGPAPKSNPG